MKMAIQKQLNNLSLIIGIVVLCAAVFGNEVSEAATYYYVATTGSNYNPGTPAAPFRTIDFAYGKAWPGDTIIVRPGTYTGSGTGYGFSFGKSGTASLPITIKSETKWGAVLDDRNNQNHTSAAIILYGSYNILDGFEITNAYHDGMRVEGRNNKIINNHIHDNGKYLATVGGGSGIYSETYASGNEYMRNYIHNNGNNSGNANAGHGMYLCGDNESAANNIVTFNRAFGLQIAGYATVSNLRVYNNVFAQNGLSGIILWKALAQVDIKNNIFYKNGRSGIETYYATGTATYTANMSYGNSLRDTQFAGEGSTISVAQGTNYPNTNPLFTNAGAGDYTLQAGSPALNVGLTLDTPFNLDFLGVLRPHGAGYDIGAYEFVELVQEPAPPSNLTLISP